MCIIKDLKINEATYPLENGDLGKVAVFIYHVSGDAYKILNNAIRSYVDGNDYHEFMYANMCNSWTRVIVSDINNMK